ncbi:MAG TPA: hypothetical protein VLH56_06160 [Dissulfurispiraceae bacterium]|nr:hypothetical protein [Dissulfurispiraceae bacterium]
MPVALEKPTLGQYLARDEIAPFVEKRLWRGDWINLGTCMLVVSTGVFKKGAVLGRARGDCLSVLARMFIEGDDNFDERQQVFWTKLHEQMRKRVWEYSQTGESLPVPWGTFIFGQIDRDTFQRWAATTVPLDRITPMVTRWHLDGIVFGAMYPQLLTEQWVAMYESPQAQEAMWRSARRDGRSPGDLRKLTLANAEQSVLLEVACHVREFFPHLVDPLHLRMA